jgi:hypothetical protein
MLFVFGLAPAETLKNFTSIDSPNQVEQIQITLPQGTGENLAANSSDVASIAQMIDQTLREEFPEGHDEFSAGKTFNSSIEYVTVCLFLLRAVSFCPAIPTLAAFFRRRNLTPSCSLLILSLA